MTNIVCYMCVGRKRLRQSKFIYFLIYFLRSTWYIKNISTNNLLILYFQVDLCSPNPCPGQRFCRDHGNTHACECPQGYVGEECRLPTSSVNTKYFMIKKIKREPKRNANSFSLPLVCILLWIDFSCIFKNSY